MKSTIRRALWVLPVAFLFACQGEPAEEGEEMAGEMAAETEMAPATEIAAESYMIEVTNPMPHDMMVYVEGTDGETELGTVPADGSATFDLGMIEGMEATLRATDADETHSVSGTVTLQSGETASWTVK